jgi:hypothetical protein
MATATITGPEQVDDGRVEDADALTPRSPEELSRRRFSIAVVIGTALTLPSCCGCSGTCGPARST